MVIPDDTKPQPGQIPSYVRTDEDRRRFEMCFVIGRAVCGRDDARFLRELFLGDIPTDLPGVVTGVSGL